MSSLLNPNTLQPIEPKPVEFERPICSLCLRQQCHDEKFGIFVIAIVRGIFPDGEPRVRDGIFDEKGKLAKLLTCPTCLPKLAAFREHNDPKRLPKGRIRDLCKEIYKRQKNPTVVIH